MLVVAVLTGCGGADMNMVGQKTYKLPDELRASLAIEGDIEDIVFDAHIVRVGSAFAVSLDREIDGTMFVIENGKAQLKYKDMSMDIQLSDTSPIMRLYSLLINFDALEKLVTVDKGTARITASYNNRNYDIIFENDSLKTITEGDMRLTVV